MKNNLFLIGFGADRTHSRAVWGLTRTLPESMVYAVLLKGPKGGLGENREGKSASRTPVEAKLGVRAKSDENHCLLMFLKGPQVGGKLQQQMAQFCRPWVLLESECHFENAKRRNHGFTKGKWPAGK